jgi:3D (Asp-Asp-Asp) domain-containing protein
VKLIATCIVAATVSACNPEPAAFDDQLPEPSYPAVVVTSELRAGAAAPTLVPVEISAYCLTGKTARGGWTRAGIVAADPSVFPLGSYIELWVGDKYGGRYLVDDTGGGIRGKRIDMWMADCGRARTFGRRSGAAAQSTAR